MILVVVGCVVAVLAALAWRLAGGMARPRGGAGGGRCDERPGRDRPGGVDGERPVAPGLGGPGRNPPALCSSAPGSPARWRPSPSSPAPPTTAASSLPPPPYRAAFEGTITQQSLSNASVRVEIKGATSGTLAASIDIVIVGAPDGSGGVAMQQGQATFGPTGSPAQYHGEIVGLEGSRVLLALADQGGSRLDLQVDLVQSGSRVTGELMSLRAPSDGSGSSDGN